ncbi:MAG TPA: amino acid--[acyl-carrier-protein] ligase [Rhodanobacteraceae bacterium]|jgi:seryl-tRNA synthetase|nr:amino acid--[acyl-carrier-protein] ligase [Rhodanobacteraceae bacterium]
MTATRYDPVEFYEGLVDHGLIVPTGVEGVFGRNRVFEDVLTRFDELILGVARDDGAEVMTFPPTIDRSIIEKTNYMDSFPHLVGAVFSFFGKEIAARRLSERVHAGEPWGGDLEMTHVCLNPAACYPLYPTMAGTIDGDGRLVTMFAWVFRHEPSIEPTRMQAYRIREYVRCGTPEQVVAWRDMWLARGVELLTSLGLPARSDVAADPFFGRGGKLLAVNQKEQQLKFEVLVPVISESDPTALCSFNYHQDKFGDAFGIRLADGSNAHTACLGFGLERVTMALFQAHGFDPERWPDAVRRKLWA